MLLASRLLQRSPLLPALSSLPAGLASYSVQIVVPPLGDSISDGTIAAVLKRSGEAVAENEVIAQIETDKVTIDIKAPSDGTLVGVVVQEQDTVVPGQLVATLDDAAAKAKLVGGAPAAAASQLEAPLPAPAAAPAAPQPVAAPAPPPAGGHSHHRTPGIRFPPRRTPDGRVVSALPAAEASAILQAWQAAPAAAPAGGGGGGSSSGKPAAAAAGDSQSADDAAFAAWAAAQRQLQQGGGASGPDVPSKFATSVTRLSSMPPRRELSARDVELIELGGAAP